MHIACNLLNSTEIDPVHNGISKCIQHTNLPLQLKLPYEDFNSLGYGLTFHEENCMNFHSMLNPKISNPMKDWHFLFSAAVFHTKVESEAKGDHL